jgi:hypothetical protein
MSSTLGTKESTLRVATTMSLTVCAVPDSICRSVVYCTVQTNFTTSYSLLYQPQRDVDQGEFRIEILALANIAQPWIPRSLHGRAGLIL